jgi:inhibitor of cysteine peptidase
MKYTFLLTAVAVFVVAIFFVACSKSKKETPSNPSSEKVVDVDEDGNGNIIHVLPGETIRIKLRSNPSTGFSWALGPIEEGMLETSGESEFDADPHREGEAGYGGCEIWTFKAEQSGETDISLFYARSWEDKEPAKTFKLHVVIGAASPRIAAGDKFDLTETDNGKNIEVHTGDIIRITLESNITTGYSWENADKVDKDILALDANDYVPDPNPEELDGVGGDTVIVYRALKPGKAEIDLVYLQSWAPSEFDERFSVTVEVLDRP